MSGRERGGAARRLPTDRGVAGSNWRVQPVAPTLRDDVEALVERLLAATRRSRMDEAELTLVDRARAADEALRRRQRTFGASIDGEPGWQILLTLFIAALEERPITVSGVCAAVGAPTTTALRHIERLARAGLLRRAPNPKDARSSFLLLTAQGERKMTEYFSD